MLSNYPETCNTILGSLLSVDTISVATIDITYVIPRNEGKTFEALNKAETRDLVL